MGIGDARSQGSDPQGSILDPYPGQGIVEGHYGKYRGRFHEPPDPVIGSEGARICRWRGDDPVLGEGLGRVSAQTGDSAGNPKMQAG